MRTLSVVLCLTLVFAAAATAGAATSRSKAQNLATPARASAAKATLTVSTAGTGTGWVTSDPAGISCGTICSAQFAVGTTVMLKGTPAVGSTAGYSGNCQPVARPKFVVGPPWCKIALTGDTSVRFTFSVASEPCFVPNLKGRTLANAKLKLEQDDCRPGTITHAFSRTVKKGRVLSQSPPPRWQREHGAKVNLVVSKGRR